MRASKVSDLMVSSDMSVGNKEKILSIIKQNVGQAERTVSATRFIECS
jgi:hypothetical protein